MFYIRNKSFFKELDEALQRSDCPFLNREEYCSRCDGHHPICPRPDMRPVHDADPVGSYVRDYMFLISCK